MSIDKTEILAAAKIWFRDTIATRHIANTEKLINPKEFDINPFTAVYLANFLTGNSSPESIAKALLLPRVLGTSITTTFGDGIQKFTGKVLGTFGSAIPGIDIEFTDQIDNKKKYCQLKSGPNTINKDDVVTIANHFNSTLRLSKKNNLNIPHSDMIVGVIYGEPKQLSGHYKAIANKHHFPVIIGQDFWHRLTGDADFYNDLLEAIGSVAIEADYSKEFTEVVSKLAATREIIALSS